MNEATDFEGLTQACLLGSAKREAGRVLKRASCWSERSVSGKILLPKETYWQKLSVIFFIVKSYQLLKLGNGFGVANTHLKLFLNMLERFCSV